MVAHLDAVTSLAVDPNGLYLLSGSKILYSYAQGILKGSFIAMVRPTVTNPSRKRSFWENALQKFENAGFSSL